MCNVDIVWNVCLLMVCVGILMFIVGNDSYLTKPELMIVVVEFQWHIVEFPTIIELTIIMKTDLLIMYYL